MLENQRREACRDNVFAICDNGFLWVGMIGLP